MRLHSTMLLLAVACSGGGDGKDDGLPAGLYAPCDVAEDCDGRVPDEGACIEAGVAFGWDKRLIGLQTDFRAVEPGGNNLMIDGVLNYEIARDIEQLRQMLTDKAGAVDLRGDSVAVDLRDIDHSYVAVTGPLGAGKTTLMEIMQRNGGWRALEEPNDENPYLEDVYGEAAVEGWSRIGSYEGWRVAVGSDGRWLSYVIGDGAD